MPEVEIKTTGFCVDLANPKAKYAEDRSSTWLKQVILDFSVKAYVREEFRAPGDIQAYFTPACCSRFAVKTDQSIFRFLIKPS